MLQTTISMTQSKFRHGKTHQRFFQDVYVNVFKWNSTKKTPRKTMLPAEIKTSRSLDSYLHSWLLGGGSTPLQQPLRSRKVVIWTGVLVKYWSKTQGPPRNPVSGNDNCHMKTTPWHLQVLWEIWFPPGSSNKKTSNHPPKWRKKQRLKPPWRGLPACGREAKHLKNFQQSEKPQPKALKAWKLKAERLPKSFL